MVAIIQAGIEPEAFALGRILRLKEGMTIDLETYVPSGDQPELFFSIGGPPTAREAFIERVAEHPSIVDLTEIETFDEQTLLAIEWDVASDSLFHGIRACSGQIMAVTGTPEEWQFSVQFRVSDGVGRFQEFCEETGIDFALLRIYQLRESRSEAGTQLFGMTDTQRETLIRAVERGYFDVPRQCSTADLAKEFGVSGQSITERVRRGIGNFVQHTFLDH